MFQIATYNNKIGLLFHSIFSSYWEMILKKLFYLKHGQLMLPFSPLDKMYRWNDLQSPVDFLFLWWKILSFVEVWVCRRNLNSTPGGWKLKDQSGHSCLWNHLVSFISQHFIRWVISCRQHITQCLPFE